ncbi:hypothetical protein ACFV20_00370 [Streptomyces sp. NPDC059696]|uniref:hypothetical protein n=1 Tax=Streptomyces sp. NPDC059696 TaxID=3346911 RepID=UPI0036C4A1B8
MADEQYRWLDRETAERLLSGEPLGAVEGAGRDQAEHLARTLGALSATPPLTSDELPGEAAAVAAFRKARAERADTAAARADAGGEDAAGVSDAGLVRIGVPADRGTVGVRPPRWARPVRLALTAALAVGMVGGVALAAGTGALRAPFGEDEPHPGASVSASVRHPERPLVSPSPSDAAQGGSTPGHDPTGEGDGQRDDAAAGPDGPKARSGGDREEIVSACRDLRDGRRPDPDRRRALRDAAGGLRVWTYCKGVLSSDGRGRHQGKGADRDHGQDRDRHDRKHDRKHDGKQGRKQDRGRDGQQDTADRKAEKRAARQDKNKDEDKGEDKDGGKDGSKDGGRSGDGDGAERGRFRTSLAPLRPAVSYSVKIIGPRV